MRGDEPDDMQSGEDEESRRIAHPGPPTFMCASRLAGTASAFQCPRERNSASIARTSDSSVLIVVT
jgi:hypothetical protein